MGRDYLWSQVSEYILIFRLIMNLLYGFLSNGVEANLEVYVSAVLAPIIVLIRDQLLLLTFFGYVALTTETKIPSDIYDYMESLVIPTPARCSFYLPAWLISRG